MSDSRILLGGHMSFAENCGRTYRCANETTRKLFDPSMFERIIVMNGKVVDRTGAYQNLAAMRERLMKLAK